jgi:hypothetical protein
MGERLSVKYELVFEGGSAKYFPRYRKNHRTLEAATAEALRVRTILDTMHHGLNGLTPVGCHNPQIHTPDGKIATVRW